MTVHPRVALSERAPAAPSVRLAVSRPVDGRAGRRWSSTPPDRCCWPSSSRPSSTTCCMSQSTGRRTSAAMILLAYLLKGIGGYVSGFLMTDVGQRVVLRPAQPAVPAHPRSVRGVLSRSARPGSSSRASRTTSTRCRTAVSETVADLARESLTVVGYVGWLFYLDWHLALVVADGGAARRVSARPARPARAADDAAGPGGAGARDAPGGRGVHRAPHREGVRRGRARGRALRPRIDAALPHQHADHGRDVGAAADHGVHRRTRGRRRALVRLEAHQRRSQLTPGRFRVVPGRRIHDVQARSRS